MKAVLDHIALAVNDMDAMIAFYSTVLGLRAERVEDWRQGRSLFPFVRLNDTTIIDLFPKILWESVFKQADGCAGPPNLNHFCLAVDRDEWEPLLERLSAAGVAIDSGPMTLSGARGDGLAVYLADPDGNKLEVRFYE